MGTDKVINMIDTDQECTWVQIGGHKRCGYRSGISVGTYQGLADVGTNQG